MFLVIPLVEFRRVLGVDINVHHENPATLLCHLYISSVDRGRHCCCLSSSASSVGDAAGSAGPGRYHQVPPPNASFAASSAQDRTAGVGSDPIRAGSVAAPHACHARPAWSLGHSSTGRSRDMPPATYV